MIGLAFDPASSTKTLWISHSDGHYIPGVSTAYDWSGKITRLTGNFTGNDGNGTATKTLFVKGLPRSAKDHETNSLAFGPDGALYVNQGSMSAMGSPDNAWGRRPEHLLSASVLRIDTGGITTRPLDVQTADGGTYNPFASGADVTVYASGIRNAYDLVFHTNGHLYVPANGSAAGGNTPATPDTLPSTCSTRIDRSTNGDWTGPGVPGVSSTSGNQIPAQPDLLFDVRKGKYYGHPNPSRCEYTSFGANPTAESTPPCRPPPAAPTRSSSRGTPSARLRTATTSCRRSRSAITSRPTAPCSTAARSGAASSTAPCSSRGTRPAMMSSR